MLGVGPAADEAAVRRAYLALARRYHPDVSGGDAARMRAVNEAWATLGDPSRRQRYDRSLQAATTGGASSTNEGCAATSDDDLTFASDLDEDDRPVHAAVRLPPWLSLVPPALFATSVVAFVVGLVFVSSVVLAFAMVAFILSCLFFLASPFIALFASRRSRERFQ